MSGDLGVKLNETSVNPGGTVSGRVGWQLDKAPRKLMIRLFWRTSGRGTQDSEMVDEVRIDDPPQNGLHDFSFSLPVEPYSYNGRLISVIWAVEAVAGRKSDEAEFVMAPDGIACDLKAFQQGA